MIDEPDIQGFLLRAYGELPHASYLMFRFGDGNAGRAWLQGLLGSITKGKRAGEYEVAVNVAFTASGVHALGAEEEVLHTFPREWQEGMHAPHRQALLGDSGESAPEKWLWGNDAHEVDGVLILMAKTPARLGDLVAEHKTAFASRGIALVIDLPTSVVPGQREHFGFHDGVAQPVMEGRQRTGPAANTVKAGEFILGYMNEYEKLPESPSVPAGIDPRALLPASAAGGEKHDLGRNGSYVVFRQLRQDVRKFWEYTDAQTRNDAASDPRARLLLASKMVGRWPSGAPLVSSPDSDNQALSEENDFSYVAAGDRAGLKCPIGSHIRRANPRDAVGDGDETSVAVSKRHRILRRGRTYGPPLVESLSPEDILAAEDDGVDRGLYFICANANIGRQFEFIQQTWINNPKFGGLYDDADPLIGMPDFKGRGLPRYFTVQHEPVRQRFARIPQFVTVRGGAYFFMPGINALRFLAALSPSSHPSPTDATVRSGT